MRHSCQAREDMQQVPNAVRHETGLNRRKTCNRCQARTNMGPEPSAGKHATNAKRGKTHPRQITIVLDLHLRAKCQLWLVYCTCTRCAFFTNYVAWKPKSIFFHQSKSKLFNFLVTFARNKETSDCYSPIFFVNSPRQHPWNCFGFQRKSYELISLHHWVQNSIMSCCTNQVTVAMKTNRLGGEVNESHNYDCKETTSVAGRLR